MLLILMLMLILLLLLFTNHDGMKGLFNIIQRQSGRCGGGYGQ